MTPVGRRPLDGVKVLDMAEEKGELCGRLLADLGAEVVRAEPPGGSPSRALPPHAPDGSSLFFAHRNANKRGVVIDPAADGDLLRDLLGWADVWIETTAPGSLAAAGLEPADVTRRYPQLIVLSMTDFGQSGPYRDYRGTDPVLVAMSGMLFRSGRPDKPPLLPPGLLAYDTASVTACFAVLSALWRRRAAGAGAHLDLSVLEAAGQAADWSLPNTSFLQRLGAPVVETRDGSGNVYPLYRCADGYIRLIVLSPRQWRSLCAWMDAPDWLRDPHWEAPFNRVEITDVLEETIGAHFASMTRMAAAEEGQRRGIAVTPVLRPHDVLHAPHFTERGTFTPAEIAPGLTAPTFAGFLEWDGARLGIRRRAPQLDEDRPQVLAAARAAAAGRRDPGQPAGTGPSRPFSGLRVVDFGIGGVGVEAGRMLADYGADVIKIEGRGYPDFMRIIGGSEMTASFASSSRGKRSLGVNLKSAAGVAVVRRLIAASDVLIENSAVGALDRIGLSWDDCRAVNPRLVYVSSQLMGRAGPWSHWIGYGPSTRPPSGMTWLWNYDDDPEGMPPGSRAIYPDHLVGRMCAVAAVAGLLARERTGTGSHVEVAQIETTIGMLADLLTAEALTPGAARPQGNHSQRDAPWGVYPCDGDEQWCVITITGDAAWQGLRAAMGEPGWASGPEFAAPAGRLARQAELDERVAGWTRTQDARQLTRALQAHGVAAGFMMYSSATADDPHLRARGFPLPVSQPGLGDFTFEGPAFHSPSIPDPTGVPAPGLGADTSDICRGVLGLSDDEISELVRSGVLEVDTAAVLNTE